MKILYVAHSTLPTAGSTKALHNLVRYVSECGVEPIIVVPDSDGVYKEWLSEGFKVVAINYRIQVYPPLRNLKDLIFFLPRTIGRFYLNRKAAKTLSRLIEDEDVKLVHSNTSVIDVGYHTARLLNIPHVYHIREYADRINLHYIPTNRVFYDNIKKSATISITHDVQEYYHLTESQKPSIVVYDGVLPEQKTLCCEQKEGYFLYAGRIEPVKGLDFLLLGYASYVKQTAHPYRLKVAGAMYRPSYFSLVKKIIQENGLEDMVEFLGERSDIIELMQHAQAIIISSTFEGFGFCMAEAMFNGCLVIGRDLTGTHEQFENGLRIHGKEIGLRFTTITELTDCLKLISSGDNDMLTEMRQRAFETVNKLYSSQSCAKQVCEFYKVVLNSQS